MRPFVAVKLTIGVLPCGIGSLLCFLGIVKMIEAQVLPSEVFGRPPITFMHFVLLAVLACGAVGGVACAVAWLKEWKDNEEKNAWLVGGLVMALIAIAAVAVLLGAELGIEQALVWLAVAFPPMAVTLGLLFREGKWLRR